MGSRPNNLLRLRRETAPNRCLQGQSGRGIMEWACGRWPKGSLKLQGAVLDLHHFSLFGSWQLVNIQLASIFNPLKWPMATGLGKGNLN